MDARDTLIRLIASKKTYPLTDLPLSLAPVLKQAVADGAVRIVERAWARNPGKAVRFLEIV